MPSGCGRTHTNSISITTYRPLAGRDLMLPLACVSIERNRRTAPADTSRTPTSPWAKCFIGWPAKLARVGMPSGPNRCSTLPSPPPTPPSPRPGLSTIADRHGDAVPKAKGRAVSNQVRNKREGDQVVALSIHTSSDFALLLPRFARSAGLFGRFLQRCFC